MKVKKLIFVFLTVSFLTVNLAAQDFGFGSWDDDGFGFSSSSSSPSVKISGDVTGEFKFYFDEMNTGENFKNIAPGNIFSGNLNFAANTSSFDVSIDLNITPVFDGSSLPVQLGEAYGRAYFGPVTLEAGLRKLSWGRADGLGPLDLINPLDYSDLSLLYDLNNIKIARPMLHAIWNTGSFSKLEAVFVPWFEGHKFATGENRWSPVQMTSQMDSIRDEVAALLPQPSPEEIFQMIMSGAITQEEAAAYQSSASGMAAYFENFDFSSLPSPKTNTLRYAQAGLRFTTTVGSTDLGFQYYYGRLPRPSISGINIEKLFIPPLTLNPEAIAPELVYNFYHQIGVDFAMVIAGFNTRAELGANITEDTDGKDGAIYNPAIVYSLGFDRDLFAGINLNFMANGSLMLFHSNIKDNLFDIEKESNFSSTRITGILSRKFLRDELELNFTALWGIEDSDFLLMPALIWSRNDVSAEIRAGIFGGDKKGELGQYRDNSWLRTAITFKF